MLRRFLAYLDKRFDFRRRVDGLRDTRQMPQIPTANVWLCVFGMFVFRVRSFNAVEQELRRPKRWERFVGAQKPSADTLGRVCGQLFVPELRELLVGINRMAWRSKAIHLRLGASYRVVAIDGHELWASRARCCDGCLVRDVRVGETRVLEYYHRVVVAQWVGVTPPGIVDLERVRPHEGEVVAARRLVERILLTYPRLIDVICADALYLEAPFIQIVLNTGKHVVVVLKQENRELYRDAQHLRAHLPPKVIQQGSRTTRLWDIPDLTSFTTLGRTVRVVWAEEQTLKRTVVGGKPTNVLEEKTWIWVTDLPPSIVPASTIVRWGHDRWDVENRCFNELSTLWHMDHCFIHNTTAMEVLLLTLACAFLTTYLFYERNLKHQARRYLTRLALAARLIEALTLSPDTTLWPSLKPSG